MAEAESALRLKSPNALGYMALLLDRARFQVLANPPLAAVRAWTEAIASLPDAAILAAAVAAETDYLVTLDRHHFLDSA